MQIRVRHSTEYRYSEPVLSSVQYLRLTPHSQASQAVVAWHVEAPGLLAPWTDSFRNLCHTLTVREAVDQIDITVTGEVETRDVNGVQPIEGGELPAEVYLRETLYTATQGPIRDFAERHRITEAADILDGLHALMAAVNEAVVYSEGDTHVHTTAAEALLDGRGVCQDHAHVFIACCRVLGIPARYVSGYLVTAGGRESHAAGHAWAEALVPDLGWVSFDPANGVSAGESYVRVAVGLDYAGASPVRGVRHRGGEETLTVRIEIEGQAQQ